MIKKFLSMLVILGMVFFIQCTDDPTNPVQESFKAKGGGGGGGGEPAPNNLSFPALLADGYAVVDVAADLFTVPYTGDYPGIEDQAQIDYLNANGPWYAQKTEGNVWQADYAYVTEPTDITHIDWGDAIEAVNPKIRRPYRIELVLYVAGLPEMEGFSMAELEYPSSKDELQGTNTVTYMSSVAAAASTKGKIVVQMTEGVDPSLLVWDGTMWTATGYSIPVIPVSFGVENNVGGKLIFGASVKGWKPTQLGAHRITFYLDNSDLTLSNAMVANYLGGGQFEEVVQGETNTPFVDPINNITYVDVTVESGGGGGN